MEKGCATVDTCTVKVCCSGGKIIDVELLEGGERETVVECILANGEASFVYILPNKIYMSLVTSTCNSNCEIVETGVVQDSYWRGPYNLHIKIRVKMTRMGSD